MNVLICCVWQLRQKLWEENYLHMVSLQAAWMLQVTSDDTQANTHTCVKKLITYYMRNTVLHDLKINLITLQECAAVAVYICVN